jgi:hypothetical protein
MIDHAQAPSGGGTTTFVFPDLPKAFSLTCPEPTIPQTETNPDEPTRPTEPPEDEPQA